MTRHKDGRHGGGHGWFVTFADLMGLLVAFFVMLVAFSTQDQRKLQIVAGSMRDAFGMQEVRYAGIIESDGLPTRPKLKNAERIRPEDASNTPAPDERDRERQPGTRLNQDLGFALAAASLRQALDDLPDLAELSKHIMIEEIRQGHCRSMFPEGAKVPYERTARPFANSQGRSRRCPSVSRSQAIPATAAARLRPLGTLGRSRQVAGEERLTPTGRVQAIAVARRDA